jgi:hypothetical protein
VVGPTTQIEYQSNFEYYLKYLCEGLRTKSPPVVKLFEEWNSTFYPNVSVISKQIPHGTIDEGLDDLIQDLYDEAEQAAGSNEDNREVSGNTFMVIVTVSFFLFTIICPNGCFPVS